jgi:hypothetical protein
VVPVVLLVGAEPVVAAGPAGLVVELVGRLDGTVPAGPVDGVRPVAAVEEDEFVGVGAAVSFSTAVPPAVEEDDGASGAEPEERREVRRSFRLAPARMPVPVLSLRGIPTGPATSVVRTSSRPARRADKVTTPTVMSSAATNATS